MTQRIDLAAAVEPVREFFQELGAFREPIELLVKGTVVAKLIPPSAMSDLEKQCILREGRQVVEKARANAAALSTAAIQTEVDAAVQEVRTRRAKRRR